MATNPRGVYRTINHRLGCGKALQNLPSGYLHLIVTADRQRYNQEQDHEHLDALADPEVGMRNGEGLSVIKLQVLCDVNHQRRFPDYRAILGSGIPSSSAAAKSSRDTKHQAHRKTAIYGGFFDISHLADTSVFLIEIYRPVFQQFPNNTIATEPNRELLNGIQSLMKMSPEVGTIESSLAKDLQIALTNIPRKCMGQATVGDAVPNGVVQKIGRKYYVSLLVMEYKRPIRQSVKLSSDPVTSEFSHLAAGGTSR